MDSCWILLVVLLIIHKGSFICYVYPLCFSLTYLSAWENSSWHTLISSSRNEATSSLLMKVTLPIGAREWSIILTRRNFLKSVLTNTFRLLHRSHYSQYINTMYKAFIINFRMENLTTLAILAQWLATCIERFFTAVFSCTLHWTMCQKERYVNQQKRFSYRGCSRIKC